MPNWLANWAVVRSPLAAAKATFALKAAPNTRRFPAIILLLIGCLPPGKVHLIRAPEIRGPPQDTVARYQKTAPQLAAWVEQATLEAIIVLILPLADRQRLRTANSLERLNEEIKRRTRVATLFPNEASLLRLASAVLSEISDEWETERVNLNMEAR
jgi:hypothetical protein